MTAIVSLLRAVNVGGNRIIAMAELRALYESLGFGNVATYVQSGNVVFSAARAERAGLTAKIETAIAGRFAFDVPVINRTAAELKAIVAKNPFPGEAAAEPGKVVVVFLPAPPSKEERAVLERPIDGPERLKLVGVDLYVHYAVGIGRSKLKLPLKRPGTTRNWKTVTALARMAGDLER
ncbi:MAG: DUF1697 domain-containing protein [Bauldia sp.]